MAFIDPADNNIAVLTDKGRELSTRAGLEGLSFRFIEWSLGRSGYDPTNPVKVLPIDTSQTELNDQIYPSPSTRRTFSDGDYETPNFRSVSLVLRVPRETASANYGIGELGIWVEILNSPEDPSEEGEKHLFAIGHMPIRTITYNTAEVFRTIVNF